MNSMWQAFGDIVRQNRWIVPALGLASAIATFLLAGLTVGLIFVIVLLAVFLFVSIRALAAHPQPAEPIDSSQHEADGAPTSSPGSAPATEGAPAQGEPDEADPPSEDTSTAEDTAERDALAAAIAGDQGAVNAFIEARLQGIGDTAEKNEIRALGDLLLVRAGDPGALTRLAKSVADKLEPRSKILERYGIALDISGDGKIAASRLIECSHDFSKTERAAALIHAGHLLVEQHEPPEARRLLDGLTVDSSLDSTQRAQAWAVIGDSFKEEDQAIAAIVSYENALSLNPALSHVRFNLAFLYSRTDYAMLSREHYIRLKATNHASASALNNLGVADNALGLPGKAFSAFSEAAESGSAIAYGNMAHTLLEAGALEQAADAINKGSALDPDNDRIVAARARLKSIRDEESEKSKNYARLAAEFQSYFKSGSISAPTEDLAGTWRTDGGKVINLAEKPQGTFVGQAEDESLSIKLKPAPGGYVAEVKLSKYAADRSGTAFLNGSRLTTLMSKAKDTKSDAILEMTRLDSAQDTSADTTSVEPA